MRSVLHLDVESYSEADLKRVGLYRYAEDLTTELNVVCYAFDDDPVRAWLPQALVPMAAIPPDALWQNGACPESIVNHIRSGGIVAAHNAQFERIVLNALGPQHGIPRLEIGQMRCTAAKAAAAGIPRNLGDAAKALGTHLKDDVGRVNMLALSRPRTGKDKRYSMADYPLRWRDLIAYCMDDVRAERDLDRSLPDLSETEQRVYELDQVINDRGIRVDIPAVKATLALVNEHKANLEDAFRTQTGYEVTQTGKVADWVRSHGYPQLPDLQAASVIAALGDPDCPEDVRRVLAIRTTHAMKAVAKYEVMLDAVSAGDRLRGMLLYHGAGTGRWCLTGDHEVLTPAGWTRLDEWRGGSLFVCDEAGAGRFDEAVAQAFPYAGKLVEWDCERFAQRATPEHRMPVVGHLGGVPVSAVHTKMKIPRTVRTSESSRYSEAQIRFFVMAQADGHCSDDAWKFSFTKQRKVFRCRHILRLLALPFTERVYPNNAGKPRTVFEVRHSRSPAWTRALGPGKEFPWEMLYAHHDAFFDELERWDGYRCGPKSVQYSTISRHNADFVQAKAHLSGRQCNALTKDRTAEHPEWNVAYICNIWLSDAPASTRDLGRTETDFTGEVYCPATATGYFLVRRNGRCWITGNSSRLVQLQNLYRPAIKDQDVAIDAFMAGDLQWVKDLYGIEPMKVFASCIRGMLVPDRSHDLLALDYAGIENRILPWMFGEEWKLAAFRAFDRGEGPDLYKLAYARAFGVKPEKVTDAQRQVGKVMELSLGYEGGVSAFATMAKTYKLDLVELTNLAMPAIPDETLYEAERAWQWAYEQSRAPTGMAKEVFLVCDSLKRLWRANHPAVVRGWKDMVDAAVAAVRRPGKVYCIPNKRIAFKKDGRWLWMRLPSGRKIGYFMPEVREDEEGRRSLSYLGIDTKTRRWMRVPTYGGRLCLAAGTRVLTEYGWAPIEDYWQGVRVWDGEEWVYGGSLLDQGFRRTIQYAGVWMTRDHEVLSNVGWQTAQAMASCEGLNRAPVRLPNDSPVLAQPEWEVVLAGEVRLRKDASLRGSGAYARPWPESKIVRVPDQGADRRRHLYARNGTPPSVRGLPEHDRPLPTANASGVAQLRREGYSCLRSLAQRLRSLLGGHGAHVPARADTGADGQRTGVLARKLSVGYAPGTGEQHADVSPDRNAVGRADGCRSVAALRGRQDDDPVPLVGGVAGSRLAQVYDIENAGPRRRFVVKGATGEVMIVHNCENADQAIARDILVRGMFNLDTAGYPLVLTVHDELVAEVPEGFGSVEEAVALACDAPAWAEGLPLAAAGWRGKRYRK